MDTTCDNQCLMDAINSLKDEISDLKLSTEGSEARVLTSNILEPGDTAWVLTSTALILFITIPGLILYYAGMVREKHILVVSGAVFSTFCLVTVLWFAIGYSLAFAPVDGPSSSIYGDGSRLWLVGMTTDTYHSNAKTVPEPVYCAMELGFAIITCCLVSGPRADRMKYSVMMIFTTLWLLIVYCPIAHAIWHHNGFLHTAGVLDCAGFEY